MLPNCEIFEIFNTVDTQESHCLTLLRGAHTERQRQHQRLIQVYGDAWEGEGVGANFQASQCIPMDLDIAADTRCG